MMMQTSLYALVDFNEPIPAISICLGKKVNKNLRYFPRIERQMNEFQKHKSGSDGALD